MAAEPLEPRQLLAFSPFTGRDTTDFYMVPATKVGDPRNPQWNMERIRAADTWWVYDGSPKSIVVVEDYGVDFRHEDFGASATTQGQFWDFGKIHAPDGLNLEFSKKGRDDFNYRVDVGREITSKPEWIEVTKPDAGQYQGNIGASIIGAKTNNNLGVAGVNWDVQVYSAKVVVSDETSHDIIARRANRAVHYLRLGEVADPARPGEFLQRNPNPQPIRAISFGYCTEEDYRDIFHDFEPVPESAGDGAGHYDFVAFGNGIERLTGDAKQGVLVTVPTGDYAKTWPTKYYSEGEWEPWTPWTTWNPSWTASDLDAMRAGGYGPGDPDNVIAVAATDFDDVPWEGNAFGNPIDIYAPGEEIVSAGEQPRGYVTESGTRQAQAHVAGAIALLYDVALQHEFIPTYHEVREAIIEGGDDIGQAKPRLNIVNSIKYLSLFAGKDLTRRPDPLGVSVTVTGGQAAEGDVGTTRATFTLTLDRAIGSATTIGLSVQSGTASAADRDFVSPGPTGGLVVTIPARSRSVTFSVLVNGDQRVEADEVFTARIVSVPGNVTPTFGGSVATWTILNDDVPPVVSLVGGKALEGSALRPGFARVFATLDKPALVPVTLQYSVINDTAIFGIDYGRPATNVITFPVGMTAMPITIPLVGDSVAEPDKAFRVQIHSAVNATPSLAARVASVTIVDDDRILVSIQPAQVVAGLAATTLTFTVRLNRAPTVAEGGVQVSYRTIDGEEPGAAIAGSDYQSASGVLAFGPGETVKTVVVTVLPRRPGQRYPKSLGLELANVSAAGWLAGGVASQRVVGRIF